MIKYCVTFSSNHQGLEKSEEYVKNLTIQLLSCAGIDGATLVKNFMGVWQGKYEDSYTLHILSDIDIAIKVEAFALNLKTSLKQESVMIEQCVTDTRFI